MADNVPVALADKVAFLGAAEAMLASVPKGVEALETHMSWVFLTDRFAYKLKLSATRSSTCACSRPEHRNALEVGLNRRHCARRVPRHPAADLCTARRWAADRRRRQGRRVAGGDAAAALPS